MKYADREKSAIDFGCGVGKALPMLSPLFKEILAVDVSKECIKQAKSVPHKNNVTFRVVDLAARKIEIPKAYFAFCCNVAMSDNVNRNKRIIQNVLSSLETGGVALFVLPAMESVSTAALALINWCKREGTELADVPKDELRPYTISNEKHLANGIVYIEEVPTKHYLFTELYSMFNKDGFEMQEIDRLEYSWETEFDSPPVWMQSPYPWDWVVAVKKL
jgi:SAM-dependent methyltransferase